MGKVQPVELICKIEEQKAQRHLTVLHGKALTLFQDETKVGHIGYVDWFDENYDCTGMSTAKIHYVGSLYGVKVNSGYHRQGVGKELFKRMTVEMINDGIERFFIDEAIPDAVPFYNKTFQSLSNENFISSFNYFPVFIRQEEYGGYEVRL